MSNPVFRVNKPDEYQKAGPSDLIELVPVQGMNPLYLSKYILEIVVWSLTHGAAVHLSGPTGTAKTSLIEALSLVPDNFRAIAVQALRLKDKPLKVYPIEMVTYEAPGELFQRRSLRGGSTFDEPSPLVQALRQASEANGAFYHAIWLREIGRVHSASIQGGLLNLMTMGDVFLPDGSRIDTRGIAYVADSNYQAETDASHTLVQFDDALKRRFFVNQTLDYLPPSQEAAVIEHLVHHRGWKKITEQLINNVVKLGQAIRRQRAEGNLLSVPPPTISGYLTLLEMTQALPHLSLQQLAMATMLGNATADDRKVGLAVFNEVFGLQAEQESDPTKGGLF